MKYLIAGLGNIGDEYANTRHNIGFMALDAVAAASNVFFSDKRYGSVAEFRLKGRTFILLKPSTYMNLSGNAISYWLKKEKIEISNLLVIADDLALPLGSIRMRAKGSDGGHNGLSNINQVLGTDSYPRIRFGIGNAFNKGGQKNYVLGKLTKEEDELVKERIELIVKMVFSFGLSGTELTMTSYNKLGKEVKTAGGPSNGEKDKINPEAK
jgi:PTH1 family peptidyl-tRNA hydrolase